jgi:sugar lactone lactonase YvrE
MRISRYQLCRTVILWLTFVANAAAQQTFFNISFTSNDIAYNSLDGKLYASVPSSATIDANTVVPIDPNTGIIGTPIAVGTNPNKLAISDDGQYLYVGLDGVGAVRRVNLKTQAAEIQFSLGMGFCGMDTAGDIEVLPGSPHSVAVDRFNQGCSPRSDGISVYDDGVARPNSTGSFPEVDSIAFGTTSSVLYGAGFPFVTMTVDANGVALSKSTNGVGIGPAITYDNGRLYDNGTPGETPGAGAAVDPVADILEGEYVDPTYFGGLAAIRPDSASNRLFELNETSCCGTLNLYVFNQSQFTEIGNVQIPNAGAPSRFIRWGARGLAFTTGFSIYMFQTPFLESQATITVLSTSSNRVQNGAALTLTATVSPSNATGTVTFSDDTGSLSSTVPLVNSTASYTTSSLLGTRILYALYNGDTTYQASGSMYYVEDIGSIGPPFKNLPANDVVYNRFDGMLYASLPGSDGPIGNSIVPINPNTGAMGTPVVIGSEPDMLAISDDGQYLYVGLDGQSAIRRFNLLTHTPEITFPAGITCGLSDMKVMPGAPHTLAVVSNTVCANPGNDIAIFDDGVARPNQTGFYVGSIAFANQSLLYAVTADSPPSLLTLQVNSSGVSLQNSVNGVSLGGFLTFDNGLLYDTRGDVVDPTTANRVGFFADPDGFGAGECIPDSATNSAFLLAGTPIGGVLNLDVFDQSTFAERGSEQIGGLAGLNHSSRYLVRWGTDGLAFTAGGQIFSLQNPVAAPIVTSTRLTSSQNPAPPAQNLTFTATVSSAGLTPSGTVIFTDFGSPLATVALNTNGVAIFATNSLAVGPHSIVASYEPAIGFLASTSNALDEIIQTSSQSGTTITVSASQNPAVIRIRENAVVLTATVNPATGPTGNVSFYAGETFIGSAPLNGSGHAQLPTTELPIGPDDITAVYEGDSNFAASFSPAYALSRSPKPH